MHKRVLIVASHYPPMSGIGVNRVTAFVRHLPQFGYTPTVLTTSAKGILADDKEKDVLRAADPYATLMRQVRGLLPGKSPPPAESRGGQPRPRRWLPFFQRYLMIPDREVVWYPSAVRLAAKTVVNRDFAVIYSTSPPPTSHLVAMSISRCFGIPWVADFRDGWAFDPPQGAEWPSWRQAIECRLEKQVVLNARRLITVNDTLAEDFLARYPQARDRVEIIPNGYNSESFATARRSRVRDDRLIVVHTGRFSTSRVGTSPMGLFRALQRLLQEDHEIIGHLRLRLVGDLAPDEIAALETLGISSLVEIVGRVDRAESLQHQIDADILLLVTVPGKSSVSTGKLYEYLAARRPILALVGDCPARATIERCQAGIVVAPDNVQGIVDALLEFYARWKRGDLPEIVGTDIEQFDFRNLTSRLARVLDECTGPSDPHV